MSYHISRLLCYQDRGDDSIPRIHEPGASPGSGALIAVYDTVLLSKSSFSSMNAAQNSMSTAPDGALGRFGSDGGLFARIYNDFCVL